MSSLFSTYCTFKSAQGSGLFIGNIMFFFLLTLLHMRRKRTIKTLFPLSASLSYLLLPLSPAVGVRSRPVVWGMQGAGLLQQPAVQLLWPAWGVQPHQAPARLPAVLSAGGPYGSAQGKGNSRAHRNWQTGSNCLSRFNHGEGPRSLQMRFSVMRRLAKSAKWWNGVVFILCRMTGAWQISWCTTGGLVIVGLWPDLFAVSGHLPSFTEDGLLLRRPRCQHLSQLLTGSHFPTFELLLETT